MSLLLIGQVKSRVWKDPGGDGCPCSPQAVVGISEDWEGGTRPLIGGMANLAVLVSIFRYGKRVADIKESKEHVIANR